MKPRVPTKAAAGRRGDTISNLLKLAGHLYAGREITTRFITDHFYVSRATAKRYLVCLEACLPVEVQEEDMPNGGYCSPRKVLRLMPKAPPSATRLSGRSSDCRLRIPTLLMKGLSQ